MVVWPDYPIMVPKLSLFSQIQMVLHHLEKNLYIPPFPVDADNFLSTQVNLSGDDGQPVPLMAMTDKHDFHLLFLTGFDNYAGQNSSLSPSFPYPFL